MDDTSGRWSGAHPDSRVLADRLAGLRDRLRFQRQDAAALGVKRQEQFACLQSVGAGWRRRGGIGLCKEALGIVIVAWHLNIACALCILLMNSRSSQKMKTAAHYKQKPNDIDRSQLTVVPDAPRVPQPGLPATYDWSLFGDSGTSRPTQNNVCR